MNLQNQLKFYLDKDDIIAAQLSKKSGVSKQVLSLWLNGASPKNVQQVKQVAEILKTSVDNLCFGEGKEPQMKSDFESISEDEWLSGQFEVKIRRIRK